MSDTRDSKSERQEQSLSLGQSLNLGPIQPSERIHSTTSAFSTEKGTRLAESTKTRLLTSGSTQKGVAGFQPASFCRIQVPAQLPMGSWQDLELYYEAS